MAFSPDARILATVGESLGQVQLWDTVTGHEIGRPFSSREQTVAFSPSGKLLATDDTNGTVLLWNTATRQQVGGPLEVGVSYGAPVAS